MPHLHHTICGASPYLLRSKKHAPSIAHLPACGLTAVVSIRRPLEPVHFIGFNVGSNPPCSSPSPNEDTGSAHSVVGTQIEFFDDRPGKHSRILRLISLLCLSHRVAHRVHSCKDSTRDQPVHSFLCRMLFTPCRLPTILF